LIPRKPELTTFPYTKIVGEILNCGLYCIIDDFVLITTPVWLGDYVHVSAFTSLLGQEPVYLHDCSAIAAGSRVYTSTDHPFRKDGSAAAMSAAAPLEERSPHTAPVTLGAHAFVGANSVVMPGAEFREGAVVGANSFVPPNMKLEEWTIYVGSPVKLIKKRPKVTR
jgi:acetyltransferase-like isoleucine patch superfamily enzyme